MAVNIDTLKHPPMTLCTEGAIGCAESHWGVFQCMNIYCHIFTYIYMHTYVGAKMGVFQCVNTYFNLKSMCESIKMYKSMCTLKVKVCINSKSVYISTCNLISWVNTIQYISVACVPICLCTCVCVHYMCMCAYIRGSHVSIYVYVYICVHIESICILMFMSEYNSAYYTIIRHTQKHTNTHIFF